MNQINRIQLTKKQAWALMDAHEINAILENDGERKSLELNNHKLFEAYQTIAKIANG